MPDISRLVIEVDSKGVLTASGNLEVFAKMGQKAGQITDNLANKFGAFQSIANKLPGPLKSIASGLMGLVSPTTAAVDVIMEIGRAAVNYVRESIEAFAKYETIKNNLETVMGSAVEAQKVFYDLQKMAGQTGFKTEVLADAASALRVTGMGAKELAETMKMLGDVSGGSAEKLNTIASTYARAMSNFGASSRDLEQLRRVGLPIVSVLRQMGIEGETSAETLKEAFRIMTSEGGMFEGAMNANAQTVSNVTARIKELKDQNKALAAEWANLPDIVKTYQQKKLAYETARGEVLRTVVELENIEKKIKDGTATGYDLYIKAELELIKQQNSIKEQNTEMWGNFGKWFIQGVLAINLVEDILLNRSSDIAAVSRQTMEMYEAEYKAHLKELELEDLLAAAKQADKEFTARLAAAYNKTGEGQIAVLEEEIREWERKLGYMHKVEQWYDSNGNKVGKDDPYAVYREIDQVGISSDEERKITTIIDNLNKKLSGSKIELISWQKIFKSAMNLSDNDTKQNWFQKQTSSITQFAIMLSTANDRAKILNDTLGTETIETLEQAAKSWEQLASEMIMSGEWQVDTELFLRVSEYAKEARNAFNEINLDKYISGLNTELSLLRMNSTEMEKQKMISEYKVTNEAKINEALRAQKLLRSENDRLGLISGASGISLENIQGKSSDEIYEEIINTYNKRIEHANNMANIGIGDFYSEIDNIVASFEELFSVLTSPEYLDTLNEYIDALVDFDFTENLDEMFAEMENMPIEFKKLLDHIATGMSDARGIKKTVTFKKDESALQLQEESIWLSKEELRMRELIAQYGDEANARAIYALEQQIDKTQALKDALDQLAEAGLNLAATGLANFANDLVKAFQEGSDFSDAFSNSLRNMLRSLIDAMPQLLLNVGLQLISKGQWPMGLAFIGASGLMSFVSGMIDDANSSGRDDEAEKLRNIQQQITDMIEAQRQQQEYYLVQKRKVNDSAVRVNDAIITPRGTVYTNPEDYIIATKTPETLMGGNGGGNVFISIQNNAPVTVNAESAQGEDGAKLVKITIDQTVKSSMANGEYDGAYSAMNSRIRGRRLTN